MLHDVPEADMLADGRVALVIGLPLVALERRHRDELARLERVGHHLPVSRLKDAERDRRVRQQHALRKGEERDRLGEIDGQRVAHADTS